MSATLRIRRMAETDAEVVATLAGELGYPSEAEAMTSAYSSDWRIGFAVGRDGRGRQGNRVYPGRMGFALLKRVFGWKFSAWSCHRRPVAAGLRAD